MELREKLYDKVAKEFDEYVEKVKKLSLDEIINKSYETAMKKELTFLFLPEVELMSIKDTKLLLKEDKILEQLYDEWLGCDLNFNDLIRMCVDEYAFSKNVERNRNNARER